MPTVARTPLVHAAVLVAIGAGLGIGPVRAAAGPWAEAREAKVRLVSRFASAPAGGDAGLGLDFELAPGWHVYWKNAGDAGYPPALELEPGPIAAAELRYPAPSRFELPGGLVAFGYEGAVVYPIDARLEPGAPNPSPVAATLDYLVCAESCIPYKVRLELALPVTAAASAPEVDPEIAPRVDRARSRLPEPAPSGVSGRLVPGEGEVQTLELTFSVPGARAVAPELFFEPHPLVDLRRPVSAVAGSTTDFHVPMRPFDETRPLPDRLRFAWTATGFELAGAAVAWEGELDVARPTPGLRPSIVGSVSIVLAAVLIAGFVVNRLARSRKPTRKTEEDR